MTAKNGNKGASAQPATDLSAKALLPGLGAEPALPQPADASLSAAFRQALGGRPGEGHLPVPSLKTGQEIARRARADKPGAPQKATPGKVHIGPRSGHK